MAYILGEGFAIFLCLLLCAPIFIVFKINKAMKVDLDNDGKEDNKIKF